MQQTPDVQALQGWSPRIHHPGLDTLHDAKKLKSTSRSIYGVYWIEISERGSHSGGNNQVLVVLLATGLL
jgi:hypothetical protein